VLAVLISEDLEEMEMVTPRSKTASVLALAFALFVTGSVSADGPTPAINGTIQFQGKPVDDGKIIFHIADGEFVGAKIKDGAYKLTRVPAGTWRVSIEAKGMPARYSSEEATPLTVQVSAGTNTFDFDLK
jgi:type 1 fimbria pilin